MVSFSGILYNIFYLLYYRVNCALLHKKVLLPYKLIYLDYIKEILASGNDNVYQYMLKWNANMCKGNKNDSALVFKTTAKGVGKSTHSTMMIKHVLGKALSLETGSEPLKSKFNSILGGKLLVSFEEIETFSASEWVAVGCILKRQITSPTLQIEAKGKDVREETNLNNYILASNNDCIQDDDGRRYFILDISTKYVKNEEYFERLYTCFNDEVGHAFYAYLYEIDTEKFNPQSYPKTQSKLDSYFKRLDNMYKYLKDEFILKKRNVDRISVTDFH